MSWSRPCVLVFNLRMRVCSSINLSVLLVKEIRWRRSDGTQHKPFFIFVFFNIEFNHYLVLSLILKFLPSYFFLL